MVPYLDRHIWFLNTFFHNNYLTKNWLSSMAANSENKYHEENTPHQNNLFSFGSARIRFCITALIAIFIVETILMFLLPLFPSMPVIITALLDAFVLVFILFLIFWPQLKKEMTLLNARFAETQETLRKSEERYRALVESTEDSIYLVNRQYCYVFMNQKHLARLGFSADKFSGRPYSDFHSEEVSKQFEAAVDEVFAMGKSIQQEHQSDRDNVYFLRTLSPVREKDGSISAVMVISKQITERKKKEEELRKLSLTDELTGLYNRRGFMTLADQQIKIAKRLKRELLFISTDLDDLKVINDTIGHRGGDQALVDTASILLETFRDSDIIARIGGDEFVVLQIRIPDDSLSVSTDRLHEILAQHNSQSEKPYKLSLSLGSVVYNPADGKTLDQILEEADAKMYEQKKSKKSKMKD
jgi:diguanylate cyclase (GGDEF)-like protein/PAS domain S-box-containing protein